MEMLVYESKNPREVIFREVKINAGERVLDQSELPDRLFIIRGKGRVAGVKGVALLI